MNLSYIRKMVADKFNNKYRISSARMKNWDYGSQAAYFVTTCTAKRIHHFGEIIATESKEIPYEMYLSDIGIIVEENGRKHLKYATI